MSSSMGSDITGEMGDHQQQPQPFQYTGVQPTGPPRKILPEERFERFPDYDVLLSSPHRTYLTTANHAYIALKPRRSRNLNVPMEVKEPLHRHLKTVFGEGVPAPTFWIGADRVKSTELWEVIPGTEKTFAFGKNGDRCYTVYEASDQCIIDENLRNGKGTKRKQETMNTLDHCSHCSGVEGKCVCTHGCPVKSSTKCFKHCSHCTGRGTICTCKEGCLATSESRCCSHCSHCSGMEAKCDCTHGCPGRPSTKCFKHCTHCTGRDTICTCKEGCYAPLESLCRGHCSHCRNTKCNKHCTHCMGRDTICTCNEGCLATSESRCRPMSRLAEDRLWAAVESDDDDAAAVQRALQDGANVNAVRNDKNPLLEACRHGSDRIIVILLDAGTDARWRDVYGWSAISYACMNGHLPAVRLLINHDIGLLEITNNYGWTPLILAVHQLNSDLVRLLLDSGADSHHVSRYGQTALICACGRGNLEIVRLMLAADVDVEARDQWRNTALHYAAHCDDFEIMLELILRHNANMFALNEYGRTPFDEACSSEQTAHVIDRVLEMYSKKLMQDHGRLALHELMSAAEYSFAEEEEFHPPLNPLRIILPLGELTLKHWRTLLYTLDPDGQTLRWGFWP